LLKLQRKWTLYWLGWFAFASAIATLVTAIHRNVTGGFLGWPVEVEIYGYVALAFTIWWFLVMQRGTKGA